MHDLPRLKPVRVGLDRTGWEFSKIPKCRTMHIPCTWMPKHSSQDVHAESTSETNRKRRAYIPGAVSTLEIPFYLTVTRYCPQLPWQKVIRGPRATHRNFAVLQLLGRSVVAVLVFFHTLVVDQVGDINQHALGSHLLAADFFFERVKE